MGASWRVSGSWKPLGGVLKELWGNFGGHRSHLGNVLDRLETISEPLWELLGSEPEADSQLMGVQEAMDCHEF